MRERPEGAANDRTANDEAVQEDAVFERQLIAALHRVDPPAGFADRVMALAAQPASVAQKASRAKILRFQRWRWIGGAIAATMLFGSFAVQDVREHHRRERQRALANRQFDTATRITEQAMEHTREQLRRSGVLQDE